MIEIDGWAIVLNVDNKLTHMGIQSVGVYCARV